MERMAEATDLARWLIVTGLLACNQPPTALEPHPALSGTLATSSSAPAQGNAPASASASAQAVPSASASAVATASASAAAPAVVADRDPSLLADDGSVLAQTEELPRIDTQAFERRVERLVTAILKDDPSLARSAFFPVVAYEQVKAIAKPARDWEARLMRAFERDIHDYHQRLGSNAQNAEFLGLSVPEASARWMKPGSEGNRVGYHRVLRSVLKFKVPAGPELQLPVASMISWRGEWYVVHLAGFK